MDFIPYIFSQKSSLMNVWQASEDDSDEIS